MRYIPVIALIMVTSAALAMPGAPPWANTNLFADAYDVSFVNITGNWYQWTVTLNHVTWPAHDGLPASETDYGFVDEAFAFVVYGSQDVRDSDQEVSPNLQGSGNNPTRWKFANNQTDLVAEWWKDGSESRWLDGNTVWFKGYVEGGLQSSGLTTAIHVVMDLPANDRWTGWVRNDQSDNSNPPPPVTPELSTWLLLSLSGLAGGIVTIRRRRK